MKNGSILLDTGVLAVAMLALVGLSGAVAVIPDFGGGLERHSVGRAPPARERPVATTPASPSGTGPLRPPLAPPAPKSQVSPHTPQPASDPAPVPFDVLDVRELGLTTAQRYVLASIEGVVNKDGPRVYVVDSTASAEWLPILNATPYHGTLVPLTSFADVVARYVDAGYFHGVVTFNGADPTEANIASPLSGIHRALLVPARVLPALTASLPGYFSTSAGAVPRPADKTATMVPVIDSATNPAPGPAAAPALPLPVLVNVTAALEGRTSRVARYQYALDHYYPLANHSAFALFGGGAPKNLRSFIIANNLFTLWQPLYVHTDVPNDWGAPSLDPDPPAERAFFEAFLAATPPNIPIYGYMWPDGANEGVVIRLISAANKFLIPSDWIENLPFLDQMRLPTNATLAPPPPETPARALASKTYVTAVWSDGDNIQYVYGFMKQVLWDADDVAHGAVPTGWTVNPSLVDLAPMVLKYYYDSATPHDCFVAGLSGKGYCKMDYFTNATVREQFLQESQALYDRANLTVARVWQLETSAGPVTRQLRVRGIFDGYGGARRYRAPRVVNDVPIVQSIGVGGDDGNATIDFVRDLQVVNPARPLFVYLHLHCWTCRTALWTAIARALADEAGVEIVRPDEFMGLLRQWTPPASPGVGPGVHLALALAGVGVVVGVYGRTRRSGPRPTPSRERAAVTGSTREVSP